MEKLIFDAYPYPSHTRKVYSVSVPLGPRLGNLFIDQDGYKSFEPEGHVRRLCTSRLKQIVEFADSICF